LAPPTAEEQRAWERGDAEPRSEALLLRASEIRPERVEWLWPVRIPLGMLTLFSGDPKVGKSLATISMIARLTRGEAPPGQSSAMPAGSAILLSAEDDPGRTLVPRLRAAGAALSKVHILSGIVDPERPGPDGRAPAPGGDPVERMPTLRPGDLEVLERTARSLGDCRLIVIDPVSAYLGDCDDHRSASLRSVLSPLKAMAERLDVAVVLVTHHNKSAGAGTNGKYRVLGSIAYVGACRANFLFLEDPDDPEGRRVLMLDNGGNLASKQPALAYVIQDSDEGPYCDWLPGTIDLDADGALARAAKAGRASKGGESGRGARRGECEEWLRAYLDRRSRRAADCLAEGKNQGFHPRAVQRARQSLGAKLTRVGFGRQGQFYWSTEPADPADARADFASAHR
jgi:hypothetical protein